jgi:hypothetical protein
LAVTDFTPVNTIARHTRAALRLSHGEDEGLVVLQYERGSPEVPFVLKATPGESVRSFKLKVRECTKVPTALQILRSVEERAPWDDDMETILSVKASKTVDLQERAKSGEVVIVRADGIRMTVGFEDQGQPISDIAYEVAEKLGVERDEFQLVVPARRFTEDEMDSEMATIRIGEFARLVVIPTSEETVRIVVCGDPAEVEIDLPIGVTVAIAKEIIEVVTDVAMAQRKLFINGEFLSDDTALVRNLQLTNGARLYIV